MHLAAVLSVNRQTDSFKICCEPLSRTLDLVRLEDCVVHSSFPADGSKLTPKWLLLNTLDEGTQDIRVIDDGIPNIVIARRDRLTLDVETIQILGDFCYNRLQPFSQWHYEHKSTRGQAVSDPAKGVALEQMSPANWAKFLAHSQEARRGQSKTTIEDTAGEVDGMAMDDGHVGDDQDALGEEKETFSDRAPRPRDAEGARRLEYEKPKPWSPTLQNRAIEWYDRLLPQISGEQMSKEVCRPLALRWIKKVSPFPWSELQKLRDEKLRAVLHKAVGERLPPELREMILEEVIKLDPACLEVVDEPGALDNLVEMAIARLMSRLSPGS
ncbi:hypothetical protein DOTSEDRAFT_20854 [Dothistroma septosporum NZE10]|uniref:Uncharacterized protein n=1 Tax=Dothistroma septosporum (strain NZE10 / CBS 128990) TaxID=675120 RepID=N1PX91_DOTSN|nr:hypothetical protein DOTSEDRAFT_20854 [Dothistroma septosporum NZE10]